LDLTQGRGRFFGGRKGKTYGEVLRAVAVKEGIDIVGGVFYIAGSWLVIEIAIT